MSQPQTLNPVVQEDTPQQVDTLGTGTLTRAMNASIETNILAPVSHNYSSATGGVTRFVLPAKGVLDERLGKVVLQECPLYSDQLKAAGRVDLIGEFDDTLSIVDFKTSKRVKSLEDIEDYFIQACTYAVMFEERTGTPIDQLVILMVVDGSSEPLVFKQKTDDWLEKMVNKIFTYHAENPR